MAHQRKYPQRGRVRHVVHQFCPKCHKPSNDSPYAPFCGLKCVDDWEEAEDVQPTEKRRFA